MCQVAYGPALLKSLGAMLGHREEEVSEAHVQDYLCEYANVTVLLGVALQISEYVNGTLYSLFSSLQLQQQARQMVSCSTRLNLAPELIRTTLGNRSFGPCQEVSLISKVVPPVMATARFDSPQ